MAIALCLSLSLGYHCALHRGRGRIFTSAGAEEQCCMSRRRASLLPEHNGRGRECIRPRRRLLDIPLACCRRDALLAETDADLQSVASAAGPESWGRTKGVRLPSFRSHTNAPVLASRIVCEKMKSFEGE
ncbi:hypothetical protein EXIGLDRAFT_160827 [Exidia glandulosa HHB12029]|uniref:Uncharacterized protein n=1 Tax=Exidia glandulosa HHB12029 TaxID=1314781 RepID=A0A165FHC1_EXIGL|nr:hypothetical protein EXIGLDRAFT_160827 [Exidia glandulosa HHB12029]